MVDETLTFSGIGSYNVGMLWLGLFNLAYGGLGLMAALYLGRLDMVALCVWVMASGFLLRTALARRLISRLRRQTR